MSINIMTTIFNSVIPDINLPEHNVKASSAKFVLLALADHAHNDGTNAYPSITRLVNKTQLSRRTVGYALEALKSIGLIVSRGVSSWDTINYTIVVDRILALSKWKVEKKKPTSIALDAIVGASDALAGSTECIDSSVPDALVESTECMSSSASDALKALIKHNNNHQGNPTQGNPTQGNPPFNEKKEVLSSEKNTILSYENSNIRGRKNINIFSKEEEDILQQFTEVTGVYCPRDEKRLALAKFLLARVAEGDRIEDFSKWAMEYGQHKGDDFGKYVTWPEDLTADWGLAMKAERVSREFNEVYFGQNRKIEIDETD